MGLLDILNGMQNGPGGQRQPSAPSAGGGNAMSPIMIALLGLLAYKALSGSAAVPAGKTPQPQSPDATPNAAGGLGGLLGGLLGGKSGGGGLGGLIPGGLGSVFGGATAGSVLSGGLGNVVKELQNNGQSSAALSWVGTGPNKEIAPDDLGKALGDDTLNALVEHTGMNRADLLAGLSQNLPHLVDQLTPNGRLPTNDEASQMM